MAKKSWRSGFVTTWLLWLRVPDFGSISIPEPGRGMARATSAGRQHCYSTSSPRGVKSIGRDQFQHFIEGEAAPTVDCRRVRRVAEPLSKPSRRLLVAYPVGHPYSDSDPAADSLTRA